MLREEEEFNEGKKDAEVTDVNPKTGLRYTIYDIQNGDLQTTAQDYPVSNEIHPQVTTNDPITNAVGQIGNFFNGLFQAIGGLLK